MVQVTTLTTVISRRLFPHNLQWYHFHQRLLFRLQILLLEYRPMTPRRNQVRRPQLRQMEVVVLLTPRNPEGNEEVPKNHQGQGIVVLFHRKCQPRLL